MYKITETYEDYDGNKRTEDFYFNFSKAEIIDMQFGIEGGFAAKVNRIIAAQNVPELIKIFKDLITRSYGQKSDDGRRFIKSEELTKDFIETPAFSQIYMRLATDAKAAEEFVNHVIPKDLADQAAKTENNQGAIPFPTEKKG